MDGHLRYSPPLRRLFLRFARLASARFLSSCFHALGSILAQTTTDFDGLFFLDLLLAYTWLVRYKCDI